MRRPGSEMWLKTSLRYTTTTTKPKEEKSAAAVAGAAGVALAAQLGVSIRIGVNS